MPRIGVATAAVAAVLAVAVPSAGALIAAAEGPGWDSPRGPMSIDPATRDVVRTVSMRLVEKVGSRLLDVELDRIEHVKDPVKARAVN